MFEWINDTPYTCPILLVVQGIVKRQSWSYGCDGWRLMGGKTYEARCIWPRWMILAECRLWNSWIGLRVRMTCGSQQREYRLRQQNMFNQTA